MKATVVVYGSSTGTCESIAQTIAEKLGVEAIDAANEKAGAIKIYDIGQPADILGQNPCIICSQVTDNAAMIGVCMEAVVAGTFGGNTIFGTLENGALSAGAINTELVPAEKVEKYNAYLQQMMDGTFMK